MNTTLKIVLSLILGTALGLFIKDSIFPPPAETPIMDITEYFLVDAAENQHRFSSLRTRNIEAFNGELMSLKDTDSIQSLVKNFINDDDGLTDSINLDMDNYRFLSGIHNDNLNQLGKKPKRPPLPPPPSPCDNGKCMPLNLRDLLIYPDDGNRYEVKISEVATGKPIATSTPLTLDSDLGLRTGTLDFQSTTYTGSAVLELNVTMPNGTTRSMETGINIIQR